RDGPGSCNHAPPGSRPRVEHFRAAPGLAHGILRNGASRRHRARHRSAREPQRGEGRVKIVLVDDQRSARRVLRNRLADLPDLEVMEASSVDEAKERIENQNPDAMLVDIRLSTEPTDRGGLVLLKWLRGSGRSTPAVMVTASTELAEIREAMRLGAQDYVLKDELGPEMLLPIVEGIRERLQLRGAVV